MSPTAKRVCIEWIVPLVVALVVAGPALKPGLLFNLDLILVPRLDTPTGFWGLGPELPRRLPLWLPISWMSSVVSAAAIGKAMIVALFVASWVGMARLVPRLAGANAQVGALVCATAGIIYSLSPFLLTRTAVGHFNVTFPHAVLPWVLPVLLRPGRSLAHTYVACFGLGFAGHFGGSVAITVVVVAILCGAHDRWIAALAVAVAAQAAWLVPGLVVAVTTDVQMASGSAFPTAADGLAGLTRLSAGGGFWNTYYQVGGSGVVVALCGLLLLAFAVVGTRSMVTGLRRPVVVLGVAGWFIAAASALPGIGDAFIWVNDHLLGGIWREGHRMLTLHLLWLAPAAALGGEQLCRWCITNGRQGLAAPARVVPLAIAALLAVPGIWGIGGQLTPAAEPDGWAAVRAQVNDEPGTVLALPWYQYFNLSLDGIPTRRVLNPLPLYLGGDVLSSSDNGLQVGVNEYGDPRERPATDLVDQLVEEGEAIGGDLADLGVRWVVVLDTVQASGYDALANDPGLVPVIADDDITLYEVTDWGGSAVTGDGVNGAALDVTTVGPALASIDTDGPVTLAWPGSNGWRRGTSRATITADGLVHFDAATGPIWNIATIPALLGQVAAAVAFVVISLRLIRRRLEKSEMFASVADS